MLSSKNKKVVLCLSLDDKSNKTFEDLDQKINFNEMEEVHFVNIFKEEMFVSEFSTFTYPPESGKQDIIKSGLEQMRTLSESILGKNSVKKVIFECQIHHDPKMFVIKYLKEKDIGLVVSATRGVSGFKGLFTSSFTDYLVKFSPCPILVLRPKE